MDYKTFKEEEIPYRTLEQFGLTQEMVEDLPTPILDDIKAGRHSPVLPIRIKEDDGTIITSRTRFKLYRKDDSSPDVLFYPQLLRCNLDCYNEEEQKALLAGMAIVSHSPEDEQSKCFVQIDRDTNQVLYIPTPVIGRNLRSLMDAFHISPAGIQVIQSGTPMSFLDGNDLITAGIDLNERTGIRMIEGDTEKWKRQLNDGLDRFNFGIFGCWVKDDTGNLSYIHENDYTEEIWAEQQKAVERNMNIKR